uniref:Uncharacterized protein n=1 Tax=Rhizophora mucronata TaxID=61149 RepID=A0A2P2QRV2_RHIMU
MIHILPISLPWVKRAQEVVECFRACIKRI